MRDGDWRMSDSWDRLGKPRARENEGFYPPFPLTHSLAPSSLHFFPPRSSKSSDSWLLAAHIRGSRAGARLRQTESSHQSSCFNNTFFHVSGARHVVRNKPRCTYQTLIIVKKILKSEISLITWLKIQPPAQVCMGKWTCRAVHFARQLKSIFVRVWARWLTCLFLWQFLSVLQLRGPR